MNEYDSEIAHPGNGINTSKTTALRPIWHFAIDTSALPTLAFSYRAACATQVGYLIHFSTRNRCNRQNADCGYSQLVDSTGCSRCNRSNRR
jgi:hypothetical protein